jgi:hypothetical protein
VTSQSGSAQIELTLDLRGTAPDKVLSRLLSALERVGDDITLVALVRDTPDYVGVMSSIFAALRTRGYWSDTSRYPAGVQRLRVQRRRGPPAQRMRIEGAVEEEPGYMPAPSESAVES